MNVSGFVFIERQHQIRQLLLPHLRKKEQQIGTHSVHVSAYCNTMIIIMIDRSSFE